MSYHLCDIANGAILTTVNLILGTVQYFVQIYISEQCSDYSWPTHPPLNPNIPDQKNPYAYGLSLILSIKFIPHRKFTNGNMILTGRRKKLKINEQCDEILSHYGIFGCTDLLLPLKSEHSVSVKPPIHPNLNVVRICKSVQIIWRSLIPVSFRCAFGAEKFGEEIRDTKEIRKYEISHFRK